MDIVYHQDIFDVLQSPKIGQFISLVSALVYVDHRVVLRDQQHAILHAIRAIEHNICIA